MPGRYNNEESGRFIKNATGVFCRGVMNHYLSPRQVPVRLKQATMPIILGQLLLVAIIGYLWGSIPAGYWMGQLLRGKDFDIRNYGSHKTGATNVLRTLGRWPAAVVFIFDLSKGLVPTLLA